MSRLTSIFDDADDDGVLDAGETVDSSYAYLGAGQIVVEDYVDTATRLSQLSPPFPAVGSTFRAGERPSSPLPHPSRSVSPNGCFPISVL